MDPDKKRLIDLLEKRAGDPRVAEIRERYLIAMDLPAGGVVLDVGCGTGVVARAIARLPGFEGSVIALDEDEDLIQAGLEMAAAEGIGERIEFRLGDAHHLELEDASVDGVAAQTAISHMKDPQQVLDEVHRVLKPDGSLAIFDGDYESRAFSCADHELGRTAEAAWRALPGHAPRLIRDMPRLLQHAGFDLIEILPFVEYQSGDAGTWLDALERFAPRMVETGLMSTEDMERWKSALAKDSAEETFFTAGNYYAFVSRRRAEQSAAG